MPGLYVRGGAGRRVSSSERKAVREMRAGCLPERVLVKVPSKKGGWGLVLGRHEDFCRQRELARRIENGEASSIFVRKGRRLRIYAPAELAVGGWAAREIANRLGDHSVISIPEKMLAPAFRFSREPLPGLRFSAMDRSFFYSLNDESGNPILPPDCFVCGSPAGQQLRVWLHDTTFAEFSRVFTPFPGSARIIVEHPEVRILAAPEDGRPASFTPSQVHAHLGFCDTHAQNLDALTYMAGSFGRLNAGIVTVARAR